MIFNSRRHAGQLLAQELKARNIKPDLVYGLARGGVAVAAEIAAAFKIPLEPLVVRKISPPGNPEFAVGAAAEGAVWWDEETLKRWGLDKKWQKQQILDKKLEISEFIRKIGITKNIRRPSPKSGNIVLADDGAATGATMLAAVKGMKEEGRGKREKTKIIVAVPVASSEAAAEIRQQVDETVILSIDHDFHAVGQFYREFNQVSWDEVKTLLQLNNEYYSKTHPRQAPPQHG